MLIGVTSQNILKSKTIMSIKVQNLTTNYSETKCI